MRRLLFVLISVSAGCAPWAPAPPAHAVHVFAPAGIESAGSHVPVLYVDEERALYFPDGVGGGGVRHPVVPSPSELVALGRRGDIVIVSLRPSSAPTPTAGP
ncbi:hypothetical protein [Myxococcus sp. Y35]|uniref:hypothetical protein n=1 Tax=Pseudomyxococcus flavus TaxID=3115648 RepID=UPI003CF60D75